MLSLVLFTCCSKESTPGSTEIPSVDDEGVEITFNSGISTPSMSTITSTRGALNTAIPKGSHVGIYGIPAVKENPQDYTIDKFMNKGDYQENLFNANYEVMSTSGTISTLQQQFVAKFPSSKSGKNGLAFYAYYPFVDYAQIETLDMGPQVIPIVINKNNMAQTNDYLYTGQIVSGIRKDAVSLLFKHALARLDFRIYSDDSYNIVLNPTSINSITVTAMHSPTGIMYLEDGEIIPQDESSSTLYNYPLTNVNVGYSLPENVSKRNPIANYLLVPGDRLVSIKCSLTDKNTGVTKDYEIYNMKDFPNQVDRIMLKKGEIININVLYTPRDATVSGKLEGWITADTRSFHIDANKK